MELRKVASIIKKMEERGEVIDDSVKEDIVMHKKKTQTILEESGHTEVLEALGKTDDVNEAVVEPKEVSDTPKPVNTDQSFEEFVASEFPAQRELSKDIEKATEEVADYVKKSSTKWMLRRLWKQATIAVKSICKSKHQRLVV